jgi:FtsP/CotA-like multicopper oxidase with cupredoxin domain
MNASQTTSKLCRMPALLALVLPLVAGNAAAITYDLVAMPFNKAMPDGTVTMWGYALDMGAESVPTVPGPPLVVPAGETSLTVNLRNALSGDGAEPVSLVIPGQLATMSPVKFTDSQGRQRVRSFTAEAAVGGSQSYTWNNLKPGTYLYHSGTHPQVQVQMGLYGAMTHDAVAGLAYAGVPYHNEVTLLFSEVDPALHAAVATGNYGPGTGMTSTIDYAPKYFLVNGEPYTSASLPVAAGNAGQITLLRLLNAGLQSRSPVLQGHYMRLVAEDGNRYPHAREQYSAFLPALKTVDAVINPAEAATYPIYDRRLADGMLAFLTVADANTAPVAANDAYSVTAGDTLTVAAPGILGNDSDIDGDPLSAVNHSALDGLTPGADGGFSYAAPITAGDYTFTYQASDGLLSSNTATVVITVTAAAANTPPVAVNDTATAPRRTSATYTPVSIEVLANDTDADGNLDPTTVTIVVNPNKGGLVSVDPVTGIVSYTPALNFRGSENFSYTVQDTAGATSNVARVRVNVK